MHPENWPSEISRELALARQARQSGNEGRARVCARRAAGMASRAYLERHGAATTTTNVLDLLRHLSQESGIDPELQAQIHLLELRVNTEFKLPEGVDLVAVAEQVCHRLLD